MNDMTNLANAFSSQSPNKKRKSKGGGGNYQNYGGGNKALKDKIEKLEEQNKFFQQALECLIVEIEQEKSRTESLEKVVLALVDSLNTE